MPNYNENNHFINKAKAEAVQAYNASSFANDHAKLDVSQVYIVWFSKVINNWKALVSTDAVNGVYIEVSYDGEYSQCYCDVYMRVSSSCIPDENLTI